MEDYYSVLGISKDSPQDEIKKAYRKLALQWHPDKNPKNLEEANRKFKLIAEAYEVLGNTERRRSYDVSRATGGRRGGHSSSRSRFSSSFRHSSADDDEGHTMDDDNVQFFSYNFRSPEEIFQEFFGTDNPLCDFFEQALNPFFGFPGVGSDRDGRSATQAFAFSNNWEIPGGESWNGDRQGTRTAAGNSRKTSNFTSTSTSTRFINGKKITTKKKIENGVETTEKYENDVLMSRTVNRSSNNSSKHIDYK